MTEDEYKDYQRLQQSIVNKQKYTSAPNVKATMNSTGGSEIKQAHTVIVTSVNQDLKSNKKTTF